MLLYCIGIPIILALILNLIIYIFKLNKNEEKDINPYIIGTIWTVLFGILGYVYYLLYELNKSINIGSISIIILLLYSLSYPFLIYINKDNILLYNMICLILSFIVSLIVLSYSKYIFIYLIPLLLWINYINIVFIIKK
jgi:hypothetical protein